MNFALPALIIILGLLPGLAFFNGYFAGKFDRRVAGVSGVEELALYILFAIPLNWLAWLVCGWFGVGLNFEVLTQLISGSVTDRTVAAAGASIRNATWLTFPVYIGILGGSFLLGSAVRRTVWTFRLDTYFAILRLRHGLYYTLQGRMKGTPREVVAVVDVLTEIPGGDSSRLYRGIVIDFELQSSGELYSLTIAKPFRGKGRGADFKYVEIPSDNLTLMGSTIHSINVGYIAVEPESPRDWKDAIRRKVWRFFRCFVFQEP